MNGSKKSDNFYFDINIKGTVSLSEPWTIIVIKVEKKETLNSI